MPFISTKQRKCDYEHVNAKKTESWYEIIVFIPNNLNLVLTTEDDVKRHLRRYKQV